MRKILITLLCLTIFASQGYAQKKRVTYYKQADIQGLWLASFAYDENAKDWVSLSATDIGCFAFSDAKNNGKSIALMNNGNGIVRFAYTLTNNTIRMYNIENQTSEVMTIKITSLNRGINFVGVMQTYNGTHKARIKFLYLGDSSDD